MKQPIRLFALGLLTASLIALIFFLFVKDGAHNTDNLANEDMIDALKDEGYHVLNDSDYIALTVDEADDKKEAKEIKEAESTKTASSEKQTKEDDEKEKSDDKDEEKDKKDKDKKKTYTIHIKTGMASSEISDKLEKKDIIKDASKFSKYLKEHDYDQEVQLGKFDVSSSMDKKEIAEAITE